MKKRHGFSLNVDAERSLAVGVSVGEAKPYRIDFVKEFESAADAGASDLGPLVAPRSRVVQGLPNDEVHLLSVNLPAMKAKALTTAIQGVVMRKQGGRLGEWITRHTLLPTKQGPSTGGQDYAVVFTALEGARESFESAVQLGCRPLGMLPGFLALDELFRRHGFENEDLLPWNLVHLGAEDRFLCVGDEHGLLFSRPLPEDLSGGAERDEHLDRMATEIERSCFFAQQAERSMAIGRIVLCGEPHLADDLAARLKDRTDIEVHRWRPEDLFETGPAEEPWRLTLHLARAVAALHGPVCEILPPGAKANPAKVLRHHAGVALAALITGAVPMMLIGGLLTSRVQQDYLDQAAIRMDQLNTRAGQAATDYLQNRALRARQDNVDLMAGGQPDVANVLSDIAARTPEDVIYGGLDLTRDDQNRLRMVLRGQSLGRTGDQAQEVFLDFHGRLAASELLDELREPIYLEISGMTETHTPMSQVAFTMEYQVRTRGGE